MEALEWWIVGAMSVLSIAVAAIIGGEMWALPAIFLPLGAGWIALQLWMAHRRDSSQRPTGDESSAQRQLVPVAVFVVTTVNPRYCTSSDIRPSTTGAGVAEVGFPEHELSGAAWVAPDGRDHRRKRGGTGVASAVYRRRLETPP